MRWNVALALGISAAILIEVVGCSNGDSPSAVPEARSSTSPPSAVPPTERATTSVLTTTIPPRIAVPSEVGPFLTSFVETFLRGDEQALREFATEEALTGWDEWGEDPSQWTSFRVLYDDTCVLGSSGSGGCDFELINGAGAVYTYSAFYGETATGGVVITDITSGAAD